MIDGLTAVEVWRCLPHRRQELCLAACDARSSRLISRAGRARAFGQPCCSVALVPRRVDCSKARLGPIWRRLQSVRPRIKTIGRLGALLQPPMTRSSPRWPISSRPSAPRRRRHTNKQIGELKEETEEVRAFLAFGCVPPDLSACSPRTSLYPRAPEVEAAGGAGALARSAARPAEDRRYRQSLHLHRRRAGDLVPHRSTACAPGMRGRNNMAIKHRRTNFWV